MKILGTLTEEILGLLEKEKDIEHEIADWNIRRDIRKGIQKIEDYLKPTSGSASEHFNPPPTEAYSGTQSRRNFGRLKATLGDFSLFCPKLRAILGDLRRFWATLGDFGRF